ncbi:MAG: AAA family ATPase, partial [Actinomycetota bacterium]
GLLREEKCFAAELLHERGLRLAVVREQLRAVPAGAETRRAPAGEAPLAEFSTDITEQASQGQLAPVVGREPEIQRLFHVLGRSSKANAVLVGDRGVGKRSIVAALAQRIANGEATASLSGRNVVELDLATMVGARRAASLDFFGHAVAELMSSADIVYFVPELHSVLLSPPEKSWLNAAELVKTALLEGRLQCISTASQEENRRVLEKHPWLSRCFTEVPVSPPTEEETFQILSAAKARFEKHHLVSYGDEALRCAVVCSNLYIKNRALPDKALDLLDEAGSYVRARTSALPDEVVELRKKIRFIVRRMENAIVNHEFEKARVFSDQERSERENLKALEVRLGVDRDLVVPVTREAIEEVMATWTGLPVATIRAGTSNPNS